MKTGYAGVRIQNQKSELQSYELKSYGCETFYKEKVSGKSKFRPQPEKMIDQLRVGDVVVVWKPDRLRISLRDLPDLVSAFREKGAAVVSLKNTFHSKPEQD